MKKYIIFKPGKFYLGSVEEYSSTSAKAIKAKFIKKYKNSNCYIACISNDKIIFHLNYDEDTNKFYKQEAYAYF
jgi:hypothetical protein